MKNSKFDLSTRPPQDFSDETTTRRENGDFRKKIPRLLIPVTINKIKDLQERKKQEKTTLLQFVTMF